MSSGWFNSSEPVRTIVQHVKPCLQWSLTWVRGGSTLPNLIEPLSSRGNMDRRIISHEFGVVQMSEPVWTTGNPACGGTWHAFGVVQLFRNCSNHCSTQETRPVVEADIRSGWFNTSEPVRTTGNPACGGTWHAFGVVQLFRNCSNHSSTHETRPVVEADMSSG